MASVLIENMSRSNRFVCRCRNNVVVLKKKTICVQKPGVVLGRPFFAYLKLGTY